VDLVTGRPSGVTSVTSYDGMRVRYVRTPLPGPLARRGLQREGAFGAVVAGASLLSRADVTACFHYADAVGAKATRPRRPVVLKLTGTVPRDRVEGQPVERRLLGRALDVADEVWVNSQYALDAMAGWGREMSVVPAGLDAEVFRSTAPRSPHVTVLCASTPDDPRKRVTDLVQAWPAIRDALPGAELLLAGAASEQTRREMTQEGVRFLGVLSGPALVDAYSSAHVVVAPSVHEALGLVTLEALACGTPVAGARSGATPELLDRPGTGALFAPLDPQACAEAVVEAVRLLEDAATPERCRTSALRWEIGGITEQVEERLRRTLGG
jgi:glycosyltransferase involved in cell wall biosynthesis